MLMNYGQYEHAVDVENFYQCHFCIMLVLGKIQEHNEMSKVQIKDKDCALWTDATKKTQNPEVTENTELLVRKNMKEEAHKIEGEKEHVKSVKKGQKIVHTSSKKGNKKDAAEKSPLRIPCET